MPGSAGCGEVTIPRLSTPSKGLALDTLSSRPVTP